MPCGLEGNFLKRDNKVWSGQKKFSFRPHGGTKEQWGDSRSSCFVSYRMVDEGVSDQFYKIFVSLRIPFA